MKLSELKNIDPELEKQLVAVGIDSPERKAELKTFFDKLSSEK